MQKVCCTLCITQNAAAWGAGGFLTIAKALGLAAVKAVVCISAIILAGRTLLRPVMRRIASLENAEIFAATTLLVILGCSALTQLSGLSQALGAFLAGLLMAETEYVLQVRAVHAVRAAHVIPALWHRAAMLRRPWLRSIVYAETRAHYKRQAGLHVSVLPDINRILQGCRVTVNAA